MGALPVPLWRVLALMRRRGNRLAGRQPNRGEMAQLVGQIAARKTPVKVGFITCSPAKWSLQTLFDALQADADFTPVFYPTLSDAELRLPARARRADYAKTRTFFANIGPVAADLYDPTTDRMQPVHRIDADLVFIQQPWGMQDLPRQLAGRALSAYVHYGYPVIRNDAMQFNLPDFHPFLWAHFVPDVAQAQAMADSGKPQATHTLVTGHPKLDVYLAPAPARDTVTVWPRAADASCKRVIFAPHHSLSGPLNMATFPWSGPTMLAQVRAQPQIDFILKPHPNLAYEMGRAGGDVATCYAQVLAGWQAAPNAAVVTGGDYFDLLRSSDAMVTDSGSFLAEYLPSGAPLIRLTRPGSATLNASGQALADAFYTAGDAKGLNHLLETVIMQGDDPLAPVRRAAAARIIPDATPSATRVMDYLGAALRP